MGDSIYVCDAEPPIKQLLCKKAFDGLTAMEKLYAGHIAAASWSGALMCLFQTSPESPAVFEMFWRCFQFLSQPDKDDRIKELPEGSADVFAYAAAFFGNLGNYRSFGDTKILPRCTLDTMEKVLTQCAKFSNVSSAFVSLWEACSKQIFSNSKRNLELGLGEEGTSTYFSSNCTKTDAESIQKFLDENKISAYNTRLFKTDGEKPRYEVQVAAAQHASKEYDTDFGTVVVKQGDMAPIMAKVVSSLQAAAKASANDTQRDMLDLYVQCFTTGDINAHVDGSRKWIQDKGPAVESYIGFIESYQDPFGTRGEWEGFCAVVNKTTSARFQALVDSAEELLTHLPWPAAFEKDEFKRPDFTSLEVLAFGSSGIPAGINIPNYDDVRQNEGFKNVSLGNVLASAYKPEPGKKVTFLRADDYDLFGRLVTESFEVQVGLHELLGHGSGKNFMGETSIVGVADPLQPAGATVSSFYADGETWDSKFSDIASTYEECRAECVGIYLCVQEAALKIFGHEGQAGEDIMYVNWLSMCRAGVLALMFYNPETNKWGQAHMQARYVILRCLLEAGEGLLSLVKNSEGETSVHLARDKIRSVGVPAIGKLLLRLQVYKSTADLDAGSKMYLAYSQVDDAMATLRQEVIDRREPRKLFVQPHLAVGADGDVSLHEFAPTPVGLIESFLERYGPADIDMLRPLWEAEKHHHTLYPTERV
eukprot:m.323607 g.323607  ORF g.323607 m.323607 type:complete len:706 (+) comp20359_c5_seq7:121-2238(+)